jgi:hypothetical protein
MKKIRVYSVPILAYVDCIVEVPDSAVLDREVLYDAVREALLVGPVAFDMLTLQTDGVDEGVVNGGWQLSFREEVE